VKRFVTAIMVLALTVPAAASAAAKHPATLAPPGNSAVTQYLETVPTAAGSKPPPPSGGQPSSGLSAGQRAALNRLGPDGKLLATVVAATAQPADHSSAARPSAPRPTGAPGVSGDPGVSGGRASSPRALPGNGEAAPSAVSSILAAATGRDTGGGVGILLPLGMLAVVLGVTVSAWRRRTARGS
jgi:hypothetical protein